MSIVVQKLLKVGPFWTLIFVPSFYTGGQIQTGGNFRGVARGPKNEGFLDYRPQNLNGPSFLED